MPEAPFRVWGSRPLACRELMPTSSDGRFGHARGFGHRARAPVSKSVGFSRCPQAPSAFIKLIVQGAIFGSNYLDCIIILHAQNLSDQTSAVNKNDRLFIYTSLVKKNYCPPSNSFISCKSRSISPYCLRIMKAPSRCIAALYYTLLVTWVYGGRKRGVEWG